MKFNSNSLQASFDKAKSVLEELDSINQNISEDIKALEEFLTGLDLKTSFKFSLKSATTPLHHEEYLIWDHRIKKILYKQSLYSVSCVSDNTRYYPKVHYNHKEVLIEKPLVEAPAEILQRIWKEDKLASFLSFLTEHMHLKETAL